MGFLSTQATTTNIETVNPGILVPSGVTFPYSGITAPNGYLICDGSPVSRTLYANLFAAIGTIYGVGNGTTTFNIPDLRYGFIRGNSLNNSSITGSGFGSTTPANQATFANHGLVTGDQVKLLSGALAPNLVIGTDYYVIVVSSSVLAFASTYANALSGTRLGITAGTSNTAVINKYNIWAVGNGASADSVNRTATFTNHKINRTGMQVRLLGGTLTGLSGIVYAIVLDPDTLAFGSTYAAAIDGLTNVSSRIAISGTNTAGISQWEDPDIGSRLQASSGGTTVASGSRQFSAFASHTHTYAVASNDSLGSIAADGSVFNTNGTTGSTGGNETRPNNIYLNYIIKT